MATEADIRARLRNWYKPHEANLFLRSRQALLDDRIPNEMIAEGKADEVMRVIEAFDSGSYL